MVRIQYGNRLTLKFFLRIVFPYRILMLPHRAHERMRLNLFSLLSLTFNFWLHTHFFTKSTHFTHVEMILLSFDDEPAIEKEPFSYTPYIHIWLFVEEWMTFLVKSSNKLNSFYSEHISAARHQIFRKFVRVQKITL